MKLLLRPARLAARAPLRIVPVVETTHYAPMPTVLPTVFLAVVGYGVDFPVGGALADLLRFDPSTLIWTNLTAAAAGPAPPARCLAGFAAGPDALYLFGGSVGIGAPCSPSPPPQRAPSRPRRAAAAPRPRSRTRGHVPAASSRAKLRVRDPTKLSRARARARRAVCLWPPRSRPALKTNSRRATAAVALQTTRSRLVVRSATAPAVSAAALDSKDRHPPRRRGDGAEYQCGSDLE